MTRATDLAQDLDHQVQDMRQVKASDEEEIARLNVAVEGARDSRRSEEEMRLRLEEMERRVDAEMRRREEMEDQVREERNARKRLEIENREVSHLLLCANFMLIPLDSWSNLYKLRDYNLPIPPRLIKDCMPKLPDYALNPRQKIWRLSLYNDARMS